MSPSVAFWVDAIISFTVALIALALLFVVTGAGLRRRLNRTFGLYAIAVALVGFGSGLANVAFWLDVKGLMFSGTTFTPSFWIALAATGFFFAGPALLTFAIAYVASPTFNRASVGDERTAQTRVHGYIAIIGFLVGLGLLPIIFNQQMFNQPYLDGAKTLHVEITSLGYVAFAGPILLALLALSLFWRFRQRYGGMLLTISSVVWLVGSLTAILVSVSFPVETLTMGLSIVTVGFVVIKNQILSPWRTLTDQLEATIAERTDKLGQAEDRLQRFVEKKQSVALINSQIAQIADPSEMLERLVELVQDRLRYHHVFFYQIDETNGYLEIQAAAGTTARLVLENRHRLPIGRHSVAGLAAAEHRPCLAEYAGDDVQFFADTALPNARSEMAAPLLVDDHLFGVLDIQSMHRGVFDEEDLALVATLATQAAVLLDNRRLLELTETALTEAQSAQRQYVQHTWRKNATAFVFSDHAGLARASRDAVWSPEIAQVASTGQPLTSPNSSTEETVPLRDKGSQHIAGNPQVLTVPILLRGQFIGAVRLHHKPGREWQTEDVDALSAVAERLGLALENARLLHDNQERAHRERLITDVTTRLRETADIETILETAVREIGEALGLAALDVQLGPENNVTDKRQ